MSDLHLLGVTGIPEVKTGDGLADLIARNTTLQTDDVVVVTSKIVSKAEGNIVILDGAAETARIASQAVRVLRRQDGHAISETAHGFICADAGVTTSNVEPGSVALLPRDPDRTAFKIRERLRAIAGVDVGVIIADAFVRAWRNGVAGVALGSCGITPVEESTQLCVVDQLASAATLVMGTDRRVPVVVVRGVDPTWLGDRNGDVRTAVVRKAADELFR